MTRYPRTRSKSSHQRATAMASEVKRLFEGKWISYKSENLEAFLEKMRVPEAARQAWQDVWVDLRVNGEDITARSVGGTREWCITFKLGQNVFPEGTGFVKEAHVDFTDGVLTAVLIPVDPTMAKRTVARKLVDGSMVQITTVDDVFSTRYFKKE